MKIINLMTSKYSSGPATEADDSAVPGFLVRHLAPLSHLTQATLTPHRPLSGSQSKVMADAKLRFDALGISGGIQSVIDALKRVMEAVSSVVTKVRNAITRGVRALSVSKPVRAIKSAIGRAVSKLTSSSADKEKGGSSLAGFQASALAKLAELFGPNGPGTRVKNALNGALDGAIAAARSSKLSSAVLSAVTFMSKQPPRLFASLSTALSAPLASLQTKFIQPLQLAARNLITKGSFSFSFGGGGGNDADNGGGIDFASLFASVSGFFKSAVDAATGSDLIQMAQGYLSGATTLKPSPTSLVLSLAGPFTRQFSALRLPSPASLTKLVTVVGGVVEDFSACFGVVFGLGVAEVTAAAEGWYKAALDAADLEQLEKVIQAALALFPDGDARSEAQERTVELLDAASDALGMVLLSIGAVASRGVTGTAEATIESVAGFVKRFQQALSAVPPETLLDTPVRKVVHRLDRLVWSLYTGYTVGRTASFLEFDLPTALKDGTVSDVAANFKPVMLKFGEWQVALLTSVLTRLGSDGRAALEAGLEQLVTRIASQASAIGGSAVAVALHDAAVHLVGTVRTIENTFNEAVGLAQQTVALALEHLDNLRRAVGGFVDAVAEARKDFNVFSLVGDRATAVADTVEAALPFFSDPGADSIAATLLDQFSGLTEVVSPIEVTKTDIAPSVSPFSHTLTPSLPQTSFRAGAQVASRRPQVGHLLQQPPRHWHRQGCLGHTLCIC